MDSTYSIASFDLQGSPDSISGNGQTSPPPAEPTHTTATYSGGPRNGSIHSSDSRVHKSSLSAGAGSNGFNPRSCVTCRRRKVKCDKKQPCSNCVRAHIECVFPSPGRAPRKARKPPDGELLERLRKLEGVVQSLGAQVDDDLVDTPDAGKVDDPVPSKLSNGNRTNSGSGHSIHAGGWRNVPTVQNELSDPALEGRFGRLVIEEGRSRYVNSSYWASLNKEVEDLKGILNDPDTSDDDQNPDYPSPNSTGASPHQGYIFGFSSQNVDMHSLHPPADLIPKYWSLYKENVDPLVKVLHIPTIEPRILEAIEHVRKSEKIHKGLEALMFSLYYGVVTSLLPNDCREQLGDEKVSLLKKYRFAIEQSLARANFLVSEETVVLQAFVMFLMLLRRNDDARVIWTLTGLVVRIAQTLGIHRDGTHFSLSPFETEMRRRLWWQICILDARASEDHGCDPTIVEAVFDTEMPLNVNDSDLHPDMVDFPEPKIGCTEMTFCLIRFEVANTFRRLQYVPPGPVRCNQFFASRSLEDKERWISECHQKLEERYLQHCDMSVPLYWVIATVSRLIMSKMWLMVYHPFQRLDGGSSLPQETKDKLFVTSLENVEYAILLETEARTMKWGWLFRTYVQWHAIAFLLSELCVRTKGEHVERAWRAVEATAASRWGDPLQEHKKGCLWRPLRKLMAKARQARAQELAKMAREMALQTSRPPQEIFQELSGNRGMSLPPALAMDAPAEVNMLSEAQERLNEDSARQQILQAHKNQMGPTSARQMGITNGQQQSKFPSTNGQAGGMAQAFSRSQTNSASATATSNKPPAQQMFTGFNNFEDLMLEIDDGFAESALSPDHPKNRQPRQNPSQQQQQQRQQQSTSTSTPSNPSVNTTAVPTPPTDPRNTPQPSSTNSFMTPPSATSMPGVQSLLGVGPNGITDVFNADFSDLVGNPPLGGDTADLVGADSVINESGEVNWASWDDMVREYGMDVDGLGPQANTPAGMGGLGGLGVTGMQTWY